MVRGHPLLTPIDDETLAIRVRAMMVRGRPAEFVLAKLTAEGIDPDRVRPLTDEIGAKLRTRTRLLGLFFAFGQPVLVLGGIGLAALTHVVPMFSFTGEVMLYSFGLAIFLVAETVVMFFVGLRMLATGKPSVDAVDALVDRAIIENASTFLRPSDAMHDGPPRPTDETPPPAAKGDCPRCRVPLPHHGRCPQCDGTLFAPADALALVGAEIGHTLADVREFTATLGVPGLACPRCTRRMTAVPFKGQPIDFCTHCGTCWLDGGEHRAVVRAREGRHFVD